MTFDGLILVPLPRYPPQTGTVQTYQLINAPFLQKIICRVGNMRLWFMTLHHQPNEVSDIQNCILWVRNKLIFMDSKGINQKPFFMHMIKKELATYSKSSGKGLLLFSSRQDRLESHEGQWHRFVQLTCSSKPLRVLWMLCLPPIADDICL